MDDLDHILNRRLHHNEVRLQDNQKHFNFIQCFDSKCESIHFLDGLQILNLEQFEGSFDNFILYKCSYGSSLKKLNHYNN